MLIYHGKSGGIVPFNDLHSYSTFWEGLELAGHVPGGDTDMYAKRLFWQELENFVTERENMAFITAVIVGMHLNLLFGSLLIT